MSSIFRRLTMQNKDYADGLFGSGEAARIAKYLLKSLETYMNHKSPEKLAEVGNRVDFVWNSVFDVEKETAPQKKYDLAEEILLRPQIMELLLTVFRLVQVDVKRKIRDLYIFVVTWCSNESPDSCVPRSRVKSKIQPKVRDMLFYCRYEVMEIISEGFDMPNSAGFYNDIVREFVKDDVCLTAILENYDKQDSARNPQECIWKIFERISKINGQETNGLKEFDVTSASFDTLQIILSTNHEAVSVFITRNLTRFVQSVQKLMASSNFFIQTKSLQLVFDIFSTQQHFDIRAMWMTDPALIRIIVLALQSKVRTVRTEAVQLFELFLDNRTNNSDEVNNFIARNRDALISFCMDSAPIHYYLGNRIEQEDALFARIAYKLINWNLQRPFTQKEQKKFEEGEMLRIKMNEEQTVQTRYQDYVMGLPTVNHEYNLNVPRHQPLLREPMRFGYPQ